MRPSNETKKNRRYIHCITSYVTAKDVADTIFVTGNYPIFSDDPEEAREVSQLSDALLINLGTLNSRTVRSMIKSGKQANRRDVPIVLDPINVGISQLRKQSARQLLNEVQFSVIRGSLSDLKALFSKEEPEEHAVGLHPEVITEDSLEESIRFCQWVSEKTRATVVTSSDFSIIADGDRVRVIRNGISLHQKRFGISSVESALMASDIAMKQADIWESTSSSMIRIGIAEEKAYRRMEQLGIGLGLLRSLIIDELSRVTKEDLEDFENAEKSARHNPKQNTNPIPYDKEKQ